MVARVRAAEQAAASRATAPSAAFGSRTALVLADRALVIRHNIDRAYPVTRKSHVTYSGNGYYKPATGACEPFRVVQKSQITNTVLCTFDEDTSAEVKPSDTTAQTDGAEREAEPRPVAEEEHRV